MSDENNTTYTISEVSDMLNITYRTLHYYEEKFNLNINRDPSGNRQYTNNDLEILETIISLKNKGIQLNSIKSLLQEKGLIKPTEETNKIVVFNENSLEIKDLLINEMKDVISQVVHDELKKFDVMLNENKKANNEIINNLKNITDDLNSIKTDSRNSEEHYKELDRKLTAWRESSERPWYKKLLNNKK